MPGVPGKSPREGISVIGPLILLTAFLGQIYIQPFSEYFRFSLSVPALSLIFLYTPGGRHMLYSAVAGVTMLAFRVLIAVAGQGVGQAAAAVADNLAVVLFYLVFGGLYTLLRVNGRRGHPVSLWLSLWVCEIVGNLAELFFLMPGRGMAVEQGVTLIVLVGAVRSGCTVSVYRLTAYVLGRYERQSREERYRQMLLFFSEMKMDLLLFQKSAADIEDAMKRSYSLYERLEGEALREDALTVARQIHEVKKDYQRISAGVERALDEEYDTRQMPISEIFSVLQHNTEGVLAAKGSRVTVEFVWDTDLIIGPFYAVVSVVNNLVVNAVEAMAADEAGQIQVGQQVAGDICQITVSDTGPGIEPQLMEYIFEPGFTTKFDPDTGEMSNGLGLIHVRHMVEQVLEGSVTCTSRPGETCFVIEIPVHRLTERSEHDDEPNLLSGG